MDDDNKGPPTRDAKGRWLKGHCPNPRGRPKKKGKTKLSPSDLERFSNTMIEVMTNGGPELMDRRTALLHKMFEDAMKGKVTSQRFLYREFEKNDERLAEAKLFYEQLIADWIINNPDFDGIDGDSIPFHIKVTLMQLEDLLNHYFPGQFRLLNYWPRDEGED